MEAWGKPVWGLKLQFLNLVQKPHRYMNQLVSQMTILVGSIYVTWGRTSKSCVATISVFSFYLQETQRGLDFMQHEEMFSC